MADIVCSLPARRLRRFAFFFRDALNWQSGRRHFTHVAWLFVVGGIYAAWFMQYDLTSALVAAVFGSALVLIALFDEHYFVIPDGLTLVVAVSGLVGAVRSGTGLMEHISGMVLGGGLSYLLAEAFVRLRGREGLGFGDVKLMAAGGLALGATSLPYMLLAASASAWLSLALQVVGRKGHSAETKIPFGSHLALSIWLNWCIIR